MFKKPETKKCKFCGLEMKYYSKVCIHCGRRQTPIYWKYLFLACIVIVMVYLSFAVSSGSPLGQFFSKFLIQS